MKPLQMSEQLIYWPRLEPGTSWRQV